jgi:hypothetical protein
VLETLRSHEGLFAWLGAASLVMFVGSLILLPWGIARIPDDYFASLRAPRPSWHGVHPAIFWMIKTGKNLAGVLLILAGILMLVLPGQGILAILVGLMLLEFPGKRRLELIMMRRRQISRTMNWIRKKAGRPPLAVYSAKGDEDGS